MSSFTHRSSGKGAPRQSNSPQKDSGIAASQQKRPRRGLSPLVQRSIVLIVVLSQVIWTHLLTITPRNQLWETNNQSHRADHYVSGLDSRETTASSTSLPWYQPTTNQSSLRVPFYIQQHCNLSGLDSWMVPESDWRRKIPAFMILGAKKSGTTGLFHTLLQHPQITKGRTKELQFFIPTKQFQQYWQNGTVGQPVQVAAARADLIRKNYLPIATTIQQSPASNKLLAGEATPDYLMFPDYSSQAVLCTVPWVKMIVVLRDPVERLWSHYNYLKDPSKGTHRPNMPSFEEWVLKDIQILQTAGVLPRNLSQISSYAGSAAEQQGWRNYQRMIKPGKATPGSDRHVCRSLYAPQLETWERQFKAAGKDFGRDFKIILSRDLLERDSTVTQELVHWLGLDPMPNNQTLPLRRSMVTQYTTSHMRSKFRAWLQSFLFQPFNERLYRFLNKPELDGIFDN